MAVKLGVLSNLTVPRKIKKEVKGATGLEVDDTEDSVVEVVDEDDTVMTHD